MHNLVLNKEIFSNLPPEWKDLFIERKRLFGCWSIPASEADESNTEYSYVLSEKGKSKLKAYITRISEVVQNVERSISKAIEIVNQRNVHEPDFANKFKNFDEMKSFVRYVIAQFENGYYRILLGNNVYSMRSIQTTKHHLLLLDEYASLNQGLYGGLIFLYKHSSEEFREALLSDDNSETIDMKMQHIAMNISKISGYYNLLADESMKSRATFLKKQQQKEQHDLFVKEGGIGEGGLAEAAILDPDDEQYGFEGDNSPSTSKPQLR